MTQTIDALPQGFVDQLLPLLGKEAAAFFDSYRQPALRGIRFRDARRPLDGADIGEPIPYAKNAYYLMADSLAGSLPLHDAGAYYIQEPSAMVPAAVLAPEPGDRVLDLCAAPGGKSTQLALGNDLALLVANEPIPSRAKILSGNIERMGIPNAVVTCAYPDQLAQRWPQFFDKILVDAPCSGEGMFRRHPESRAEWTPDTPKRCHERQLEILRAAARMLRPGGRLVYSTCTFNAVENEGTITAFLREHPHFHLLPIVLAGLPKAPEGMLRLWPHRFPGEGHFCALLEKTDSLPDEEAAPACMVVNAPDKNAAAAFQAFAQEIGCDCLSNVQNGDRLSWVPNCLPPLNGIKVLRAGLHMGALRGKLLIPDHALALACPMKKTYPLDAAQTAAYLHGDTLPWPEQERGYCVLSYQGYALGFGKASDGQLKNHYPKGLRRP